MKASMAVAGRRIVPYCSMDYGVVGKGVLLDGTTFNGLEIVDDENLGRKLDFFQEPYVHSVGLQISQHAGTIINITLEST